MSHSPTPPGATTDILARLHKLLSDVALPKSKSAKNVSVPLFTFQSFLDLTVEALRSARTQSPLDTLSHKIDSLAAQIAKQAPSYAQALATGKPAKAAVLSPIALVPSVPVSEPHPPRFDFILRQLDYKHPVLAHDTPADIQRKINDILTNSRVRSTYDDFTSPPLRVRAVAKLRNGNIRLLWHNKQERDTARINDEEWLPQLSTKLEVFYTSYRVVIHGAPTTFNLDEEAGREEAAKTIVRENGYLGQECYHEEVVRDLRWMTQSGIPASKSHSSLVLSFTEPAFANLAIENGIAVGGRLLRVQRFRSLPTQCYNCHRFGHIARYCKSRHQEFGRFFYDPGSD
ncbi:hypothetical protein OH76DRAFT_1468095 [Lentinus brumalis]|uniref:CCHC-type domain-containing protein n=1 Tax=Lentinus brumalis TaxID=2498619 RepID=A0A371DVK3_9APHY|nr:hypothetical protein OH76DRAFT_1468095 [Polyporus brumalis]